MWNIAFTSQAKRDSKTALSSIYKSKIEKILRSIKEDPFNPSDSLEKLEPKAAQNYSKRVNAQHRIVYHVDADQHLITIASLWLHYE
jgi:Txe/YoeB family toxin of toxin-antitoxin system